MILMRLDYDVNKGVQVLYIRIILLVQSLNEKKKSKIFIGIQLKAKILLENNYKKDQLQLML